MVQRAQRFSRAEAIRAGRRASRLLENLESRLLLSALPPLEIDPPTFLIASRAINFTSHGSYGNLAVSLALASPLNPPTGSSGRLSFNIRVSSNGTLDFTDPLQVHPGDNPAVVDMAFVNGAGTVTFLQAEVSSFAFQDNPTGVDALQLKFSPIGGTLVGSYTESIGMSLILNAPTFNGDFTRSFSGSIEGVFGGTPMNAGSPPSALGDFVWDDYNNNGIQDGNEPGIQGVQVQLMSVGPDLTPNTLDDVAVNATTTDLNGIYHFNDFPAGQYFVSFGTPAGYTISPRFQGGDATMDSNIDSNGNSDVLTVGSNFSDQTIDAGFVQFGSISGTKYNDLNGDGSIAGGEPGLQGWTIDLIDAAHNTVAQRTTDVNGNYSFGNVLPGSYTLAEESQSGWVQTLGAGAVTLSHGQGVTGENFANFQLGTISGTKLTDTDGNGFANDAAYIGPVVTLNLYKGGVYQTFATTDAGGNYSFGNLGPGTYTVQEVVPTGWIKTAETGATIVASSGFASANNNFADFQAIGISGMKYNDVTGNGQFDGSDAGLANWTIGLFIDTDGVLTPTGQTATTGLGGTYAFNNLGPLPVGSSYAVREVQQDGWVQTSADPADMAAISGTAATGANFGNFQKVIIRGHKFEDHNGNHVSDGGDQGLQGWQILVNGSNTGVVTDSNGDVSFAAGPGTYTLQEVLQAGWTQTFGNAGYSVIVGGSGVASGGTASGNTFGNFRNISVSGTKFNDIDGNGFVHDSAYAGPAVTINLLLNGNVIKNAVIDSNGIYAFNDLGPGSYTLAECVPAGWIQTAQTGAVISAGSGVDSGNNNFADFKLGTIGGTKFDDTTGDGFGGDATYVGAPVTINLLRGGVQVATTTTGLNGAYLFTGVGPGTYTVVEVAPSGWQKTAETGATITATSGFASTGNNFANFKNIAISGYKYQDLSGDGNISGDPLLDGVTVQLKKAGDSTFLLTAVTANGGFYSFGNLGPGSYTVSEAVPTGWVQTLGATPYTVAAQSGIDSTKNNFADFKMVTIGGQKFNDLNGNGVQDSGETGLSGWHIKLNNIDSAVTDASGNWSVSVGPGTFSIQEIQQGGWTQTFGTAGYSVTTVSGVNVTGKNFGNFKNVSISGLKFNDVNGNGVQDSGETGLQGWVIDLVKGTTVVKATTQGDGTYTFSNVGPGTYTISEEQQAGWIRTSLPATYTVTTTSGNNVTGKVFGNYQVRECFCNISCVYYIINGCTTVTSLSGNVHQGDTVKVVFTLGAADTLSLVSYTAPDNYFVAAHASQQVVFDFATGTFCAGQHSLTVVVPNCNYQIDFVCGLPLTQLGPEGSNIFYTPQGRLIAADNGGTCAQVVCTSPNGTGSIAGTVYSDLNNSGTKEAGEAGLANIRVTLTGTATTGEKVRVTLVTDSSGNYKFSNLKAGTYKISEGSFDDFYDGKDKAGTSGGTVANDVISNITLASGVNATGYLFAELDGGSISGTVFKDYDKDGCIDTIDRGLANVKLTLTGYNDLGTYVCLTTCTDANGVFKFDNLRAGTYVLTETEPSGFTTTKDIAGTSKGTVSGDTVTNIVLKWGADAAGYNFGEYKSGM